MPMWLELSKTLIRLMGITIGLLLLVVYPVYASVHEYPEGDGKVMYRSLQTLRDERDRAWQVVLFKRIDQGQVREFHLRLTGFPGMVELSHPASLRIVTSTGQVWEATDVEVPYTTNIGEYDLRQLIPRLDTNSPLNLQIPLAQDDATLVVPPFVVQEWRRLQELNPHLPI